MKRLTRLSTLDDYREYVEKMKLLNETPLSEYKYLEEAPYQLTTSNRKEVASTLAYYENIQEKLDCPIDIVLDALYYGVFYKGKYYEVKLSKNFRVPNKWVFSLFYENAYEERYFKERVELSDYNKTWYINYPKKPLKNGTFTCDLTKKPLSFGKVENEEKKD